MAKYDVAFLLVPKFSMIALYGAVEPLRVANRFAGDVFAWRFLSINGDAVTASNGIPVSVSGRLSDVGKPAMAVVSASYEHERGMAAPMLTALRKLARLGVQLGAIDTGPFILARAGLLDGYRATCHWESLPGFRESFPDVQVADARYEMDRDRLTSAGGAAAIDMMLAWIGKLLGRELAVVVADQLVHFRTPEDMGQGRATAQARYRTADRRLLAVIAAMEQQMEEPLGAHALAGLANVSVRQMERLFREQLKARPMGFYRTLRLERAEQLLNYSSLPVRDVALATGFSTLAEFSRAFTMRYGLAPSRFRRSGSPLANQSDLGIP